VSISGDLERARTLGFASDESAAKDLLLSLVPDIERADRDDLLLEVFAQLGELYLVRGAYDGVAECVSRIRGCLAAYAGVQAVAGTVGESAVHAPLSTAEIDHMRWRYARRAQFLDTGLAAARGDHDAAATALTVLEAQENPAAPADLADEHRLLLARARILCATALCDDELHIRSIPLWDKVIADVDAPGGSSEAADHLHVTAGIAYGRFCVETGRLAEGEKWLRRAGARAHARGWLLATARTQLERAGASWSAGDHESTESLASEAYPVIAQYARAHDVSRCWLYLGLTQMATGDLQQADQSFEHAERHLRELARPLPMHRMLLQRSWVAIFCGRYAAAVELVAQAREWLDSSPQRNWLHYARLDDHLGTIWRADALSDLGFDGAGEESDTWEEVEERQKQSLGIITAEIGSPQHARAMTKLEQAAELKVPAALAVDSVRYSIADADARMRWATRVSARMLAGAFAVAWEWENTGLVCELIEYHSARGAFSAELSASAAGEWAPAATTPLAAEDYAEPALAAAGPETSGGSSLTRLGPLPPLRMDPSQPPILTRYRQLAQTRYGCAVTADESEWSTWP